MNTKRCPFCGENPKVGYGKVKCMNPVCEVQPKTTDVWVNNNDAVIAWNKRVDIGA